jgi:hypothetical protein
MSREREPGKADAKGRKQVMNVLAARKTLFNNIRFEEISGLYLFDIGEFRR